MFYKEKSLNLINFFQESHKTLRALSFILSTVLITFVFTTPTFAAGVEAVKSKNQAYIQDSPERMQDSVDKALVIIKHLRDSSIEDDVKEELSSELSALLGDIKAEESYAEDEFATMLEDIEAKGLADVFKERVLKMQTEYEKRGTTLKDAMQSLVSEHTGNMFVKMYYKFFGNSDVEALDELNVTKFQNTKQQEFDPNNLPFNLRKSKQIKPKTDKLDFISKGFTNQPLLHYAALGDFDYSTLADASNAEYLAQSDEVNITQAIKDKAAQLDYDVVQIYNFVRNNIEFIPTWGAVQGAELTLGAKRGNAMDISSLLIALLRASKIPARYVHGTVELSQDKVKNWFGGWENINSALTFAYSNGLPAMTITGGGRVDAVRMEHIWVEVATDYHPSRGAKNHKADAWIPLDASYKQYEFSDGMDALSASGVDINATLQSFINSADINETEGSVAHMDNSIIEEMLAQAQTNLESNISTEIVDNNQSLFEVIGGQKIIEQHSVTLPHGLSMAIIATGAKYASLPSSLQQKVTYYLEPLTQEAAIDEMLNGRKTVTLPYAKVNNQKVTLSYAPASQADKDALESRLPQGEITDASQLPSSLPSYIHVKPQVKLNGQVILEGGEMRLGDKLNIDQAVLPVNSQSMGYKKHKTHAGDYLALGTVSQSVSPDMLKKLQKEMQRIQNILASTDKEQIEKLTREDIQGNMHYATMLGYYGSLLGKTESLQREFTVKETIIGYGTFGFEVRINSRFGLATGIKIGGIGLDIPMTKVVIADNNNQENFKNYRLQAGAIASSLEHETPEQMYNDASSEGISTIKAFSLANRDNQKIYTIDTNNMLDILPKIQASSLVMSDIRGALSTGKQVVVHEKPVSVPGWRGTGYMVIDTINYDTAYLIGGGGNGGFELISGLQSFLWMAIAGTLGAVDGYTSGQAGKKYMFADRLKYYAKMAGISKFIGIVALLASVAQIMADDTLSYAQKLGQITLNATIWLVTSKFMKLLVVFFPQIAAILGAMIAGTLAYIGYVLAQQYLSLLFNIRIRNLYYV